jgi:hypothetical protein
LPWRLGKVVLIQFVERERQPLSQRRQQITAALARIGERGAECRRLRLPVDAVPILRRFPPDGVTNRCKRSNRPGRAENRSERKSLASDAAYTNQQVRREFLERGISLLRCGAAYRYAYRFLWALV